MKRTKLFFTIFIFLIGISSCQKDLLDKVPLNSYSDGVVWSDPNLVLLYVNEQYNIFPAHGMGFLDLALSSACDESIHQYGYLGVTTMNAGGLEPSSNVGFDTYTNDYKYIYKCNVFLSRIDKVPATAATVDLVNRLKGEILFIRAYCYQELTKRFAGVPIITEPLALGSDYTRARDTYEACVNFMVADLDAAAALLPTTMTGENFGRATKGAALALKARVLLYAASDLFNVGVTNAVYGYTSGSQTARYTLAQTAAKAVIDMSSVYQLYTGAYANIFTDVNTELIFMKRLDPIYQMSFFAVENTEGPNGGINAARDFGGWNTNSPSQTVVDAFGMNDGLSITESPLYNAQNPYANRDPRFYTDINYDGTLWHGVPLEFYDYGRNSPLNTANWDSKNSSRTGYSLRKHLKADFNYVTAQYPYGQPWPMIRLAEMYLNYAEASYGVGDEVQARWAINKLRQRLTPVVPDVPVTTTGVALRDKIRNERQVELCFEAHRFWDVRRWKIAEVTENLPLRGIQIIRDEGTGVKTYTVKTVQARVFKAPQHYLFPIPLSEMNKVALLQNPGY